MSSDDSLATRRKLHRAVGETSDGQVRSETRPNRIGRAGDSAALPGSVQFARSRSATGGSGKSMIIRARTIVPMAGEPIEKGAGGVKGKRVEIGRESGRGREEISV